MFVVSLSLLIGVGDLDIKFYTTNLFKQERSY
jgi:hypothetical protein